MKMLARVGFLLIAGWYAWDWFSTGKTTKSEAKHPAAASIKRHVQAATADALNWAADSLRDQESESESGV